MSAIIPKQDFDRGRRPFSQPTAPLSIHVLMVDDSAVMRSVLRSLLREHEEFASVHQVATAREALAFLEKASVDIILLDHEMPGTKGLDALPDLVRAARGARIVMLCSHCREGNQMAVAALAQGASEAIAKPSGGQSLRDFGIALVARLRQLAAARQAPHETLTCRAFPADLQPSCLGIGASTGGIHALQAFFEGARQRRLGIPILITQHLPEAFTPYYLVQVERMAGLPVRVGMPGMRLRPDHIYIAPGDHSLGCERDGVHVRLTLDARRDPLTHARPSVNIMFAALARVYGARALGVVLTGMGRDGTVGASHIVDAGGAVIAQDPASSVVWGMPGSVVRTGLACAALPPGGMFDYLCENGVRSA